MSVKMKTLKSKTVWELRLDLRNGQDRRNLKLRFDSSEKTEEEVKKLEVLLKKAWKEGWLDDALMAADQPVQIKTFNGKSLFSNYSLYWLDVYPAATGRPRRRDDLEPMVKRLNEFFGKMKLSEIRYTDIYQFRNTMLATKSCRKTLFTKKRVHEFEVTLNTILKSAKLDDVIKSNPYEQVRRIPARERRPVEFTNFLWPQDWNKYLEAAKSRNALDHLIFMVTYETGGRQSEIWALTRSDFTVDLQGRGVIHIHRTAKPDKTFGPTKTHDERWQMLSPTLTKLMVAHKKEIADRKCPLLFPNTKWKPKDTNSMDKALTETAEAAGVRRITMHGLRHSAATHLAMTMNREGKRVSEEELRRFLGHSESTNTIRRYLNLAKTRNQLVPQLFEEIYLSGTEYKENLVQFGAIPIESEARE